jgi:hypothetical protein
VPGVEPLRVCAIGLSLPLLREAGRHQRSPVELTEDLEQADAVLSLKGELAGDAELRRRARALGVPILVIKSDRPAQLERGLARLLERRAEAAVEEPLSPERLDDAHDGLEECRLAVEQVVLPQGRPVELLPRSERVRRLQAELVGRYRLRSAVYGRGGEQRLRVFPA